MLVELTLPIVIALLAGFLMACAVGANDVANAMGTSVGSKVITLKQAVILAAFFEACGAMFASSEVTATLRQSVVDLSFFQSDIDSLMLGMVSCLLASATWLMLATYNAWPVSTTHSIIGSLVGFACLVGGYASIHWMNLLGIFLSWVTGPIISGFIGFLLFRSIQYFILTRMAPVSHVRYCLPIYSGLVGFFIGFPLISSHMESVFWICFNAVLIACLAAGSMWILISKKLIIDTTSLEKQLNQVERLFGSLVVMTASLMAFAHGSNDVANAIGPLSVIIGLQQTGIDVLHQAEVPKSLLIFGAVGVVVGLAAYGYRIIETVGSQITYLTPTRSFSAQLSTSIVVVMASYIGLPISTTQILVGSILGVGFARGLEALNIGIVKNIFMSWIVTLPSGAILSAAFFTVLKPIML